MIIGLEYVQLKSQTEKTANGNHLADIGQRSNKKIITKTRSIGWVNEDALML